MREIFPSQSKKRYLEKPFNLLATNNKLTNRKMGTSKSVKNIKQNVFCIAEELQARYIMSYI